MIYFWGSVCVFFDSNTVKSDCPVEIFRKNDKIFKDLIQTVGLPITSFTVSGDMKKTENI